MGFLLDPIQTSFVAGELNPKLDFRKDLDRYYAGAERLRNVILLPEGGIRRRDGSEWLEEIPRTISDIASSGTVTTPEGGTAANAVDDDSATLVTATTLISSADPYVLVHIDLGSPKAIKFAAVRNLRQTGAAQSQLLNWRIQWSTDNISFNDFIAAIDEVTNATAGISIRRGVNVGAQTARYWRVAATTTAGLLGNGELSGFELWQESATLSKFRTIRFEFSTIQRYIHVATDRNLRVFKNGVYQADINIPFTSAELAIINWTQSLDTLLLFHATVQSWRVKRGGADDEWIDDPIPFTNIPTFDFGSGLEASFSATRGWPQCGTFHQGRLWLGGSDQRPQTAIASKSGDFFNLDKGTAQDDEAIEFTADSDDVAAIFDFISADYLFMITQSAPWFILPNSATITPSTVNPKRIPGKEAAEGPGIKAHQVKQSVLFVQSGGKAISDISQGEFRDQFKLDLASLLSSHLIRTPVDVTVLRSTGKDEGELYFVVNADGSLPVYQSLRNQNVQAWMSWHTAGVIGAVSADLTEIVFGVTRTINGVARNYLERFNPLHLLDSSVRLVATRESFTATAGQAVYVYTFTSPPLSSDLDVKLKGVSLDEGAGNDYTVNLGGKTVTLTAATAATVAAGDTLRIAIKIATVTGLDHLEGETLRVRIDDTVSTDVTVVAGAVTLAEAADDVVEVGLDFPDVKEQIVTELKANNGLTDEDARFNVYKNETGQPQGDGVWARSMPADFEAATERQLRGRKKRVYRAIVSVLNTEGFYFAANDGAASAFDFREFGESLLDRPPPRRSGDFRVEGLEGYSLDGAVDFTQRDPIRMTILGLIRNIKVS